MGQNNSKRSTGRSKYNRQTVSEEFEVISPQLDYSSTNYPYIDTQYHSSNSYPYNPCTTGNGIAYYHSQTLASSPEWSSDHSTNTRAFNSVKNVVDSTDSTYSENKLSSNINPLYKSSDIYADNFSEKIINTDSSVYRLPNSVTSETAHFESSISSHTTSLAHYQGSPLNDLNNIGSNSLSLMQNSKNLQSTPSVCSALSHTTSSEYFAEHSLSNHTNNDKNNFPSLQNSKSSCALCTIDSDLQHSTSSEYSAEQSLSNYTNNDNNFSSLQNSKSFNTLCSLSSDLQHSTSSESFTDNSITAPIDKDYNKVIRLQDSNCSQTALSESTKQLQTSNAERLRTSSLIRHANRDNNRAIDLLNSIDLKDDSSASRELSYATSTRAIAHCSTETIKRNSNNFSWLENSISSQILTSASSTSPNSTSSVNSVVNFSTVSNKSDSDHVSSIQNFKGSQTLAPESQTSHSKSSEDSVVYSSIASNNIDNYIFPWLENSISFPTSTSARSTSSHSVTSVDSVIDSPITFSNKDSNNFSSLQNSKSLRTLTSASNTLVQSASTVDSAIDSSVTINNKDDNNFSSLQNSKSLKNLTFASSTLAHSAILVDSAINSSVSINNKDSNNFSSSQNSKCLKTSTIASSTLAHSASIEDPLIDSSVTPNNKDSNNFSLLQNSKSSQTSPFAHSTLVHSATSVDPVIDSSVTSNNNFSSLQNSKSSQTSTFARSTLVQSASIVDSVIDSSVTSTNKDSNNCSSLQNSVSSQTSTFASSALPNSASSVASEIYSSIASNNNDSNNFSLMRIPKNHKVEHLQGVTTSPHSTKSNLKNSQTSTSASDTAPLLASSVDSVFYYSTSINKRNSNNFSSNSSQTSTPARSTSPHSTKLNSKSLLPSTSTRNASPHSTKQNSKISQISTSSRSTSPHSTSSVNSVVYSSIISDDTNGSNFSSLQNSKSLQKSTSAKITASHSRNEEIKNDLQVKSTGHNIKNNNIYPQIYNSNKINRQRPRSTQLPLKTVKANEFDGYCKIPEICSYSINRECKQFKSGCPRLHADTPFHWQFYYSNTWCNFRKFQSNQMESAFCLPDVVFLTLSPLYTGKCQDEVGKKLFDIFGTKSWSVNFDDMKISSNEDVRFMIRRISTSSAAVFKHRFATVYEWYWQIASNLWIKYGEMNDDSQKRFVPNVTCEEIEQKYMEKRVDEIQFANSIFQYKIDFRKMIQINLDTNKERNVRRRPKNSPNTDYHKRNTNFPEKLNCGLRNLDIISVPHYSRMGLNNLDIISVAPSSMEYNDILILLKKSLQDVSVRSIKRIENLYLNKSFIVKLEYMRGRSKDKLNIQYLFHGTIKANVESICQGNLDWRLHGGSHGNVYGRGTYFSNDLTIAKSYCCSESPCSIFVVLVIVGDIARGSSDMVKPPLNPRTNMEFNTTVNNVQAPKIFVKYDSQEYYPEYVVEIEN